MPSAWTLTPPYFLTFAFLCGIAGFRTGWRTKSRVALPLIQGALGWVAFLIAWSFVGAAWSAGCVLAWAAGATLASIYEFVRHPQETDQRVLRAASYRASMLDWLATGRGPESQPLTTAVGHLRELVWYTAAAAVSANFGSIVLGAILLNYMNAYVATLLRAARHTGRVIALAWPIWSGVRVAAYVLIGAAAGSLALRLMSWPVDAAAVRALAIAGGAGALIDLLLKLALSRRWGRALAAALDLEAARENRSSEIPLSLHLDD